MFKKYIGKINSVSYLVVIVIVFQHSFDNRRHLARESETFHLKGPFLTEPQQKAKKIISIDLRISKLLLPRNIIIKMTIKIIFIFLYLFLYFILFVML